MGNKNLDYIHYLNYIEDIFKSDKECSIKLSDAFTFLAQSVDLDTVSFKMFNSSLTHYKIILRCNKVGEYRKKNDDQMILLNPEMIAILLENQFYSNDATDTEVHIEANQLIKKEANSLTLIYPITINDTLVGCVCAKKVKNKHLNKLTLHTTVAKLRDCVKTVVKSNIVLYKDILNQNLYVNIFQSFASPFIILNEELKIIEANPAFEKLFSKQTIDILFMEFLSIVSIYNDNLHEKFKAVTVNQPIETEILLSVSDEKRIINLEICKWYINERKYYGVIFKDITEFKQLEKELRKMAYYDLSTGLSNRNYFELICKEMETTQYQSLGILSFDLDNLKKINDSYGHEMGDRIISRFSDKIKDVFGMEYLNARVGGDEFIVIMRDRKKEYLEERILEFAKVIDQTNQEESLPIHFSIGKAFITHDERLTIKELIGEADQEMLQHKHRISKKVI